MLTIGNLARLGQVSPRMLRHYDEIGLLSPDRVDPATGYRYYTAHQLARLHRLVALRDLGFNLDQIGPVLDEELTVDELRGMLRMRRAQIEATVEEEQARLRLGRGASPRPGRERLSGRSRHRRQAHPADPDRRGSRDSCRFRQ
jgi:DNA-binding transcriptional MerR regulator